MGRKPRIEFDGGIYHIIQRGNNKEFIFNNNIFKNKFISIIVECKENTDIELYGFVIMDNHYHIIMRTHEVPLKFIMHQINLKYSKFYNFELKRTGHVFQDRYKSILVNDERYLLSLLRYVHQNPVKANMCSSVSDYFWSSDSYYRKNNCGKLVDIDIALNVFSNNRNLSIIEYKKFMDIMSLEDDEFFDESIILGEFPNSITDLQTDNEYKKTLDDILRDVTNDNNIFEEIKNGSRKRELTIYKKLYAKKAFHLKYNTKEIGTNINISASAIVLLKNKQ